MLSSQRQIYSPSFFSVRTLSFPSFLSSSWHLSLADTPNILLIFPSPPPEIPSPQGQGSCLFNHSVFPATQSNSNKFNFKKLRPSCPKCIPFSTTEVLSKSIKSICLRRLLTILNSLILRLPLMLSQFHTRKPSVN